ncbi:protein-ADP-ribose hydrolase [Clostridium transplantifaecale]|uniref:protein-ADP-ribose hydrolase n=1 Tax=Clostridium transplantifaecale TaxID=2479838 RepID=UPI000F636EA7|nr:protein-ADP-ribose hydrolase [Clostridium transplantifaecale]
MIKKEQAYFLIQSLINDMPEYGSIKVPDNEKEQWTVIRSLMNVRPPRPVSQSFLEVQNEYLSELVRQRGVIDCCSFEPSHLNKRIFLWQGDITRLKADAIVNAANSSLLGCFQPCHSCIDNMIHSLSGVQLRLKCNEIMQQQGKEEPSGAAKITPGYNLPSRYVLHTVGPIITGPLQKRDCDLLAGCYRSCLELSVENHLETIVFCCISTGVFQFPQERAAEIAVKTVTSFLERNSSVRRVIFNVFTDKDNKIYQKLLNN